jgi:hypothetical protein
MVGKVVFVSLFVARGGALLDSLFGVDVKNSCFVVFVSIDLLCSVFF